jgi:hypothetical protein
VSRINTPCEQQVADLWASPASEVQRIRIYRKYIIGNIYIISLKIFTSLLPSVCCLVCRILNPALRLPLLYSDRVTQLNHQSALLSFTDLPCLCLLAYSQQPRIICWRENLHPSTTCAPSNCWPCRPSNTTQVQLVPSIPRCRALAWFWC